jgi:hypothetical protein
VERPGRLGKLGAADWPVGEQIGNPQLGGRVDRTGDVRPPAEPQQRGGSLAFGVCWLIDHPYRP